MKILIIATLFPNKINPVRGIFVKEQVEILSHYFDNLFVFDCTPYNFKEWFAKDCFFVGHRTESSYNVFSYHPRVFMTERFPKLAQFSFDSCVKKLLKKYIAMFGKPDLIISHFSFMAGFSAKKIFNSYGIPFVVIEHGSLFLQNNLCHFLIKQLNDEINKAKRIICVSEHLKESIIKLAYNSSIKKIMVINNYVNPIFTFNEQKSTNNCFVFLSAGMLLPNKNFDLLINSFCKAFSKDERVILEIAGSGKEHDTLQKMILSKNRENQIFLVGKLDRTGMLAKYQSCDSFVLFSQYETFGLVYREAMAVGRPVVSSLNGGIEENWEDGFGILVKTFDADDCAIALRQMVNRYQEYDKQYISKRTLELYSQKTTIEVLKRIILEETK